MKRFPKMALEFCQIVDESSENHFLNKKWSVYGDLIPNRILVLYISIKG